MILYHVTINLEDDIQEDWLGWMQSTHIPEVMATGQFLDFRLAYMMFSEVEGHTYSIQYLLKDMEALEDYMEKFAPQLQADHQHRYEGKFVAYRTVHEVLDCMIKPS